MQPGKISISMNSGRKGEPVTTTVSLKWFDQQTSRVTVSEWEGDIPFFTISEFHCQTNNRFTKSSLYSAGKERTGLLSLREVMELKVQTFAFVDNDRPSTVPRKKQRRRSGFSLRIPPLMQVSDNYSNVPNELKLFIVLDIDRTLLISDGDVQGEMLKFCQSERFFNPDTGMSIQLRPGAQRLVDFCRENAFHSILFSAGNEEYVEDVGSLLGCDAFSARQFWEQKKPWSKGGVQKDLDLLLFERYPSISKSQVLIIDDKVDVYSDAWRNSVIRVDGFKPSGLGSALLHVECLLDDILSKFANIYFTEAPELRSTIWSRVNIAHLAQQCMK